MTNQHSLPDMTVDERRLLDEMRRPSVDADERLARYEETVTA